MIQQPVSLVSRTFPVIFAAPSGAGKTSIAERLMERRGDLVFSVSMTTRPPRGYERDGEHYHFLSEPEFRAKIDAGELLEWANVHGYLYGTPRKNLEQAVAGGKYLILDIDIQGARAVRRAVQDAVAIFVLPPSGAELGHRLAGRGSEDEAVRRARLVNAREEIRVAAEFDYVIVNETVDRAVEEVDAILLAEAARTNRRSDLGAVLRRLDAEIEACLHGSA